MISHRQRLQACLKGETVDRIPVALWRHFPVDDQDPEKLASAHMAFQKMFDFDLVKVTPSSSFSVRDWGVEDRWEGNVEGTRSYTRHVIHQPSDWASLPVLSPAASHLAAQLNCLGRLRSSLGPETPLLQTVFSPLSQAKHLAGEEVLLSHLRDHPAAVKRGLETIVRSTIAFIQAAEEMHIDGIFYAVQHAQSDLLSRDEFLEFGRSSDLPVLSAASRLWCNMLHVHGENLYFDAVADYPVQIINWHDREAAPSLSQALSATPAILCGGLNRTTLVYYTPEDVQREALEAIANMAGGRFILSTGCVVPIIAPYGNIRAARESVEGTALTRGR
jgi:uroporphyrinogen decarboxylase